MLKLISSIWLVILCNISAAALGAANFEYFAALQSVAYLRFGYDEANVGYDGTTPKGVCCFDTCEVFAENENKSSFTGKGSVVRGFFEFLDAKTVAPEMVTVSRWGHPGLEAGDWAMKGEFSQSTFLRSFKRDPNPSNVRVPFKDWATGENFVVPKDSLSWGGGWEKFKGVFGQRIYDP